jgi:hypothetical protein
VLAVSLLVGRALSLQQPRVASTDRHSPIVADQIVTDGNSIPDRKRHARSGNSNHPVTRDNPKRRSQRNGDPA